MNIYASDFKRSRHFQQKTPIKWCLLQIGARALSFILISWTIQTLPMLIVINPYKSNGISHSYHLDQSISVLRVPGLNFPLLFKFKHCRTWSDAAFYGAWSGSTLFADQWCPIKRTLCLNGLNIADAHIKHGIQMVMQPYPPFTTRGAFCNTFDLH